MSGPKVLAFGAWDSGPGYPRAEALLLGLRRSGAEVAECRFDLPFAGAEKRRLLRSPSTWPRYYLALRSARRRAQRQLTEAVAAFAPDLVLVPYPGHHVVRWARAAFTGPLLLDLFLSAYDTAVIDRQLFRPRSLVARYLRHLDRSACAAADRVIVDTGENAEFIAGLLGLPRERFTVVPVSDPREPACPPAYAVPPRGGPLELLFFGTGVPLHGLEHLLAAVAVTDRVRLTLIGGAEQDRSRARRLPAVRVLEPFVAPDELSRHLAAADVVAGVFGTSPKTDRVIPFKVMQALAAGRPVLTARTRATRRVFRDGVDAMLVPAGDPLAIAACLRELVGSPARLGAMAAAARALYEERFSLRSTGEALRAIGTGLLPAGGRRDRHPPELLEVR